MSAFSLRARADDTRGGGMTDTQLRFEFRLLDALPVRVKRITNDSRKVQPGDVFLAYPGEHADGRDFIPQAIVNGAVAILWESKGFLWDPAWQVTNVPVPNLRTMAGVLAAEVYDHPSRTLWTIGITGTNGKTSCSHWLAQALTETGRKTAVVGTLGNGFMGRLEPSPNTTPDPIVLQQTLKQYLDQGAGGVAMEVSSHALDQDRVSGTEFDVAVFTNLSRDHLDYHGDMKRYGMAKSQLFSWPELKRAVINIDDAFGPELVARAERGGARVLTYGFEPAMVRGSNLEVTPQGIAFDVDTPWGRARVASGLLGRFNAHNLLAVLTALLASGAELAPAVEALKHLQPVAGRMQQVHVPGRPLVVVDYAHTPDALEKVLNTLREIASTSKAALAGSRLICVFGCGGSRDKGKRPLMGGIASRLADTVVVTSDNPRNESPRAIIDDIVAGMDANYHVLEDRAAAIDYAIRHAAPQDVVLIAGKGHEDYQEIAGVRLPFSDVAVAQRVLESTR